MLYFGSDITASVSGSTLRDTTCAACGRTYTYPVHRTAKATRHAPFMLGTGMLTEVAESAAEKKLVRVLDVAIDAVPCLHCGHVQDEMIGIYRDGLYPGLELASRRMRNPVVLAIAFCFAFILTFASADACGVELSGGPVWIVIAVVSAAVTVAPTLLCSLLRKRYIRRADPNRDIPVDARITIATKMCQGDFSMSLADWHSLHHARG